MLSRRSLCRSLRTPEQAPPRGPTLPPRGARKTPRRTPRADGRRGGAQRARPTQEAWRNLTADAMKIGLDFPKGVQLSYFHHFSHFNFRTFIILRIQLSHFRTFLQPLFNFRTFRVTSRIRARSRKTEGGRPCAEIA